MLSLIPCMATVPWLSITLNPIIITFLITNPLQHLKSSVPMSTMLCSWNQKQRNSNGNALTGRILWKCDWHERPLTCSLHINSDGRKEKKYISRAKHLYTSCLKTECLNHYVITVKHLVWKIITIQRQVKYRLSKYYYYRTECFPSKQEQEFEEI